MARGDTKLDVFRASKFQTSLVWWLLRQLIRCPTLDSGANLASNLFCISIFLESDWTLDSQYLKGLVNVKGHFKIMHLLKNLKYIGQKCL